MKQDRVIVEIDFAEDNADELHDVVADIAREMKDGNDRGSLARYNHVEWRVSELGAGVEIDSRQRLAAAHLLMGFDFPADLFETTRSMMDAAMVAPGLTMEDIGGMGEDNRRKRLHAAKELIEAMLVELG